MEREVFMGPFFKSSLLRFRPPVMATNGTVLELVNEVVAFRGDEATAWPL